MIRESLAFISALPVLAILLSGCVPEVPKKTWANDQCLRAELFQACLRSLPAGPTASKYNDWDEVVSECESAAYRQSARAIDQVKAECRSDAP